jgi:4-coumarate--CoA ligase
VCYRWVRTGDEVVIDKNNDVFIVDRLKEIMKVRGFQVAPAELEGHLLDHPYVTDVCVVGVPDEFSGEVPMAFVVASSEARGLVETGSHGVSEVKNTIRKVRFYLGRAFLDFYLASRSIACF